METLKFILWLLAVWSCSSLLAGALWSAAVFATADMRGEDY
jgi:hypothetical protein